MKKNTLSLVVGILLVIVFAFLLFSFQVRQTQVAVVTQFGKFSAPQTQPGLYFKLPWPIQQVYKFENRLQNFEKKFEQTPTKDSRIILITVFAGWKIADPAKFLTSFDGDAAKAEEKLENLIRTAKNGVIGQYDFADLVSADPKTLKFDEIEKKMLEAVQPLAKEQYGVDVVLLGIKQLGLPENVTTKVFARMKAERERLVKQLTSEGEKEAAIIRAEAKQKREEIIAEARGKAEIIRGEGDREAAKSFAVFKQEPDLAIFLLRLKALEASLKDRSTLILDQQTPPFDMLSGGGWEANDKKGNK
ncbi:MAG TPA: protease modulator HflC [Verrucomicrobiae bacterium]